MRRCRLSKLPGWAVRVESRTEQPANDRLATAQPHGEQTTVGEIFSAYLDWILSRYGADHGTYKQAKERLADLSKWLGSSTTVAQMLVDGCQRIKAWATSRKFSATTMAAACVRVKSAFAFVCGGKEDYLEWLASNPVAKLNTGSGKIRPRIRTDAFLSKKQIETLFAAIDAVGRPQFRLAVEMLLLCGCRPSEMFGVSAADVRKDHRGNYYWWVDHKNGRKTGQKRRIRLGRSCGKLQRRFELPDP